MCRPFAVSSFTQHREAIKGRINDEKAFARRLPAPLRHAGAGADAQGNATGGAARDAAKKLRPGRAIVAPLGGAW